MDSIKKSFGARIKEIRELRNLSQEGLSELVDMESRHISRIETGKCFTTLENIAKIADVLDVPINELFAFEHKKDRKILIQEIDKFLQNTSTEKIELIYKLVKNIII